MTTTGGTATTTNNTTISGGNTSQNCCQSDARSAEEKALDRALVLDKDSFKSLKSDVEFSTWFPIFKAEAIKQGFGDLLDSKYKPPPGQETIFEKRQKVFYSFLGHHLMTKKGGYCFRPFRGFWCSSSMEQAHCLPLNVSQGSFNEGQFLDQLLGLIQMPNLKMKYFGWSRYIQSS